MHADALYKMRMSERNVPNDHVPSNFFTQCTMYVLECQEVATHLKAGAVELVPDRQLHAGVQQTTIHLERDHPPPPHPRTYAMKITNRDHATNDQ